MTEFGGDFRFSIQPQLDPFRYCVHTVANDELVRKNRVNLAVKIDLTDLGSVIL